MADTTKILLEKNMTNDLGTLTAGAASQTLQFDGENEKMLILVLNTDTADAAVQFSSGDHWQASIGSLISDAIAQNDYAAFVLETARFKDSAEELTMEVLDPDGTAFTGTVGNVEYALLELP